MSSQYPTTINAAIASVFQNIEPNENGEIDALKLRGVLMDVLLGLYNTFAQPDDALLAQFPAYDPFYAYEGGTEVVVKHNDRLWLFISPSNSTGQYPGTNGGVWQPFNVLGLAHFKNMDTWLDKPGPFAVSAQQLREHLEDEPIHQEPQVKTFDVTIDSTQILSVGASILPFAPFDAENKFPDFIDVKAQMSANGQPYTGNTEVPIITVSGNGVPWLKVDLADTIGKIFAGKMPNGSEARNSGYGGDDDALIFQPNGVADGTKSLRVWGSYILRDK